MGEPTTKDGFLKLWDALLKQGVHHQYHKGQVLFYKGHTPYGIFIIVSGKVGLFGSEHMDPNEAFQASLQSPIGLDVILSHQCYPFTAVAQSDVKAVFIAKSSLDEFCKFGS